MTHIFKKSIFYQYMLNNERLYNNTLNSLYIIFHYLTYIDKKLILNTKSKTDNNKILKWNENIKSIIKYFILTPK